MSLTTKQKQQFKAQAQQLKPIIQIGNKGLTEAVNTEIERALHDHELIKIKIAGEDREERLQTSTTICQLHNAELIQNVGRMLVVYRKNPD